MISEHATAAEAFREIDRLSSEMVQTGAPSDAVELLVIDSVVAGAYTFAPPETFDFSGDWGACVGDGCTWNWLQFTIRDNMLVRVSCDGVVLTPPSGSPVRNGEFSFLGDDGAAISGRIVSPEVVVGTINVGRCVALTWPWSAWRDNKSGAK